jgi:hypothetical protein
LMGGTRTRSVEVECDPTEYLAALRQWWPEAKQDLGALLREESVGMAEALMIVTPPFKKGGGGGLTPQAKKVAMRTIKSETDRVFKPMWTIPLSTIAHNDDLMDFMALKESKNFKKYPPAVAKLLKSKNPDVAYEKFKRMFKHKPPSGNVKRTIIKSVSPSFRNSKRVQGRLKVKNHNEVFYVRDRSTIKSVTQTAWRDIGLMKAQWAHAAKQVAGKFPSTMPAWVSSQPRRAAGGADNTKSDATPTITLVNHIGNKYGLGAKFNVVQLAFNIRAAKLRYKLAIWLKKQINTSNAKTAKNSK